MSKESWILENAELQSENRHLKEIIEKQNKYKAEQGAIKMKTKIIEIMASHGIESEVMAKKLQQLFEEEQKEFRYVFEKMKTKKIKKDIDQIINDIKIVVEFEEGKPKTYVQAGKLADHLRMYADHIEQYAPKIIEVSK